MFVSQSPFRVTSAYGEYVNRSREALLAEATTLPVHPSTAR